MSLHKGQGCAWLVSEDVHCHVKGRMIGQEHLQPRVFVAEEGLAFYVALMADKRRWFRCARQRFIGFLEDQNTRRWTAALELDVHAGGEIDIAAGLQPVSALIQQNAGSAVDDINEILIGAGIAHALTVALVGDEKLRKARAHGRGYQHMAYGFLPAGEIARHKTAGGQQRVALSDDVSREAKWVGHSSKSG